MSQEELLPQNTKQYMVYNPDELSGSIQTLQMADIFQGMELSQLGIFFESAKRQTYTAGTVLFTPDESSERLYILTHGRVDLFRISAGGKRLVTRQILPGSVFGLMRLLGQTVQGNFAETIENSEIYTITRQNVLELLKNLPGVALRILEIVGNRLRLLEERFLETAYSPVKIRLAHFLLTNSDQSGMLANITHEEIGDNVGAARQTVTEILGVMQKQKFIRIKHRSIQILNRKNLEKFAKGFGS
jgi:CRP-like cAMP-binding protein